LRGKDDLMVSIDIPLNGVNGEIKKETLIISSSRPLKTLSSSILGGGFNRTKYILNHHVEKDFFHTSPEHYLKNIALGLGVKEEVVGMMTAADLTNLSVAATSTKDFRIVAVVTGGVSNAAAAGEEKTSRSLVGTINTILLIDGSLTKGAMAGTIITVTEAKTRALWELDVKSITSGETATGTTTDAVVVACTGRGSKLRYAGTATVLGELVGKATKNATKKAIKQQEGWA
jgi:iron complex transport system ATP-binding protein